ncbi:MAG: IS3 family transposase [Thermoleophilia bacterium]
MKFRLIDEERAHHPVSRIACAVGVTAQGYYAWRKREPSGRYVYDQSLKATISEIHKASFGIYGAPRIHAELRARYDIRISKKRVARLMGELGLSGVSRRRKGRKRKLAAETPAAPDLVKRNFTADGPNQLWVADITYIPTWEGWLFLAAVMDIYTKRIVGWSMRDDLKADIVIDALGMAATRRKPGPGLVHHSDRGGQYRSLAFGKTLRDSDIMASMGSRGDAYDNAAAESFMATIKTELVHRNRFKTKDEARLAVFRYIEGFYNPLRRHSALDYLSPAEYETMLEASAA